MIITQCGFMSNTIPDFKPSQFRAVAIGSSTGAPTLLQNIICGLPADLPVPILIAQHLPPKFTRELALTMDRSSAMTVIEAEDGMPVFPGTAYLGPGRTHMRVVKPKGGSPRLEISDQPPELLYKPSVDQLFESCAQVYRKGVLAIVMTGIGRDGVLGAQKIVDAGGMVLTQSKKTCAVYGMPKSCDEAGLSSASLDPEGLRLAIHQLSPSFEAPAA